MTRRRKTSTARALSARTADRHELYETAVQRPELMIGFIEDLAGRWGMAGPVLREDFCGTANLAAHWVASRPDRRAVGIDLDRATLDWAERHNRRPLGPAARRLRLVEGDVMAVHSRADVVVSLNFSHFIYHRRADLAAYLRHAWRCLKRPGMMLCDAFGGPQSITPDVDRRHFGSFEYLWEQVEFNPITNRILCKIHFRFPNGTMMRDAFVYDWRMWSLAELIELIEQAGFDDLAIYFESEQGFVEHLEAGDSQAWVAYLAAWKGRRR